MNQFALWKQFMGLTGVIALTILIYFGIGKLGGVEGLQVYIEQAGLFAPLVFVLVRALIFVIAPLSSFPLQMSAGAMFGVWQGVLYSLVGSLIGGSINFWLARLLGRPFVVHFAGDAAMVQIDSFSNRFTGWRQLLLARVLLSPVYDFVSYAAGFTRMHFGTYFIVSALGGLVPTTIFVIFGTSLYRDFETFIVAGSLMALFLLASYLFKKRFNLK